ncbi:hypothetical protein GCM10023322_44370 [Rugosimonospora acidiphila]|uniref:Uncharacterized protein n=1 Tax=Rugosimonospora acidiphila TaxID=556531 RepID=A0ABP9S2J6_9ACTN
MSGMPTPRTSPSLLSSDTCTGAPLGVGDEDGLGDPGRADELAGGGIHTLLAELPPVLPAQAPRVEASAAPPRRKNERLVVP